VVQARHEGAQYCPSECGNVHAENKSIEEPKHDGEELVGYPTGPPHKPEAPHRNRANDHEEEEVAPESLTICRFAALYF
jgi:hypothetical protein